MYLSKGRRFEILVQAESEVIGDRSYVQLIAYRRVQTNHVQRVAQNKRVADAGVIKRLHTESITRAEQRARRFVPDRKREIADEVIETTFLPHVIRKQDQLGVIWC